MKFRNFKRNFILTFSASTEKMVKPLCSFTVCQVVTPRDVRISWSKIQKQLNLKSKSRAINTLKKPLSFWQNVVFTDETRVRISSSGIFRLFRRNGTRFFENTKILSSDKRSLMFRGAIQSDGRKLLVKCPNKLKTLGYLEILKIYKKMHFLDIIFQQDNAPAHKSKDYRQFLPRKRVEGTGMASIKSRSESY